MFTRHAGRGLAITEVAVVGASLALLVAVVLPGLAVASRRDGTAVCLSNLGRLGQASLMYAVEDARAQLVPMHQMQVLSSHEVGFTGPWAYRTAMPSVFGGRTAVAPLPTESGDITVMLDDEPWGRPTRPLNRYAGHGVHKKAGWLEVYHCPADVGYYEDGPWVEALNPDVPAEAAGIPCYDFLGNSYRANTCGALSSTGGALLRASFNSGPVGHWIRDIPEPDETVLYSDPLFYSVVRHLADGTEFDPVAGWHGQFMADNVAYCDGSARMTEVGELYEFTEPELEEMGVCDPASAWLFLRRGPTWRMDCYPSPGAFTIVYRVETGSPLMQPAVSDCWPFADYTVNDPPF
jgi:hypothetical protein